MANLADCPVPYRTLYHGGSIGIDEAGAGAAMGFHLGVDVPGGSATDVLDFLTFLGGTPETVTVGGVVTERLVPLKHPYLTSMVAMRARAEKTGKGIAAPPGWTDWKVHVDFALVPYLFGGDTPYLTLRRRYGASAITQPGRAYAVGGTPLNHDIAVVIPEILYSATKYNVPTLDDSVFKVLSGKVNAATFLGFAAETVRFDGVEDEINTNIGMVTNRTVSLSLAWRPRSWNEILLPTGVWAAPINISDGSKMYATGDFSLLLT